MKRFYGPNDSASSKRARLEFVRKISPATPFDVAEALIGLPPEVWQGIVVQLIARVSREAAKRDPLDPDMWDSSWGRSLASVSLVNTQLRDILIDIVRHTWNVVYARCKETLNTRTFLTRNASERAFMRAFETARSSVEELARDQFAVTVLEREHREGRVTLLCLPMATLLNMAKSLPDQEYSDDNAYCNNFVQRILADIRMEHDASPSISFLGAYRKYILAYGRDHTPYESPVSQVRLLRARFFLEWIRADALDFLIVASWSHAAPINDNKARSINFINACAVIALMQQKRSVEETGNAPFVLPTGIERYWVCPDSKYFRDWWRALALDKFWFDADVTQIGFDSNPVPVMPMTLADVTQAVIKYPFCYYSHDPKIMKILIGWADIVRKDPRLRGDANA